jgi:hypothetical protein
MSDLTSYGNIYANLAQSTYNGRKDLNGNPHNFVDGLTKKQKKKLSTAESVSFYFPNAKDAYGNDASKVYLQPDPTVKTIKEQRTIPFSTTETPQTYTYSYQKGLLTDEKAA